MANPNRALRIAQIAGARLLAFYFICNTLAHDVLKLPYAAGPLPEWLDRSLAVIFGLFIVNAIWSHYDPKDPD